MSIAVVLLHYNRWANLRLALRALREQTLDSLRIGEVEFRAAGNEYFLATFLAQLFDNLAA